MANNPPLTQSEIPVPTTTVEDHPSVAAGFPGNLQDDDALAQDEYFMAADEGPEEFQGVVPPEASLPSDTRLITRWIPMNSGFDQATRMSSIQLLAPDQRRKRIIVSALAVAAAGFVLLASEPFSLNDNATIDTLSQGQFLVYCPLLVPQTFVIEEHTGRLFAACNASAAGMLVSAMSVTC